MPTMTPATHGIFIPEVWAKDIQTARRNKLVASNLINKQYEKDLSYGDTVHIVSIGDLTADVMTPGTALVPVAPNETEQTLVIDQYYGKAIEIQEVLKRQTKYELRQPYTERMGNAIAVAMDTSILNQWANVDAANQLAAVPTLTFDAMVNANTPLDSANVPMEDRAWLVNAVGLADLRKLPEFTAYDETGRTGVREKQMGIVGTIYGAPVYLTNAVPLSGGQYKNLLVHKDAISMAVQLQPNVESDRDILKKSDLVSISALWGVKTVRPDHAVVLPRTA